jgi:hypothetical protein
MRLSPHASAAHAAALSALQPLCMPADMQQQKWLQPAVITNHRAGKRTQRLTPMKPLQESMNRDVLLLLLLLGYVTMCSIKWHVDLLLVDWEQIAV